MYSSSSVEPVWRDLIQDRVRIEFDYLAARILSTTLLRKFANDPTPDRLERCASELRELFLHNADRSDAKHDLEKIFA